MPDQSPADWTGLDPTEPIKNLAIAVLKRAVEEDGFIAEYHFPTDSRDERQMARLAAALPAGTPLPGVDTGNYYLFHVVDSNGRRCRVVKGEDEVIPGLFLLALIKGGYEMARKYEIRPGMLS